MEQIRTSCSSRLTQTLGLARLSGHPAVNNWPISEFGADRFQFTEPSKQSALLAVNPASFLRGHILEKRFAGPEMVVFSFPMRAKRTPTWRTPASGQFQWMS